MTAEHVFRWYRAYRLFYDGAFDFKKYGGHPLKAPPLIKQRDRSYFYRIAQKMSDPQIHALFQRGFFFNPRAHVSDLLKTGAESAALKFASRAENGETLLRADLYDLAKYMRELEDVHEWLYGIGFSMPGVLQDVIAERIPLDIACLVLLIPQPTLGYHWCVTMANVDATGLGPQPWIDRLKKLDQLLYQHRPSWRLISQALATEFWASLGHPDLTPRLPQPSNSLF